MAQPFATGAVHVFIGMTVDAAQYVGTCESFPMQDVQREWDAVMNDLSGSKLPLDYVYEGEQAIISCVFTRWNQAPLDFIDSQPNPLTTLQGTNGVLDTGSMMAVEGNTFHLWLLYAFGAAKAIAYTGMALGRHYPQTMLIGPDRIESGSRPMKQHRIFQAWRQLQPNMSWLLYDQAGLPGLPALIN